MVHSTRTNPLDFPLSTPEQIHSSRHPSIQPRQYYMSPFTSPKLHKTHRDIDRLHQTPSNTPENISSVSPQFGHKPQRWGFFFKLLHWAIKIPKPPYVGIQKIIGLCSFLHFLAPSERNYNLQSFWITLYCMLCYAMFCYVCVVGFGKRAVSCKTPFYLIY